ncbi:hypothetical protein B0H19DRAFT_1066643 [Mycena capillaripes]|nr:hypothetical protein B0H19DRAFT_1066643 [Mycena capillaripes]
MPPISHEHRFVIKGKRTWIKNLKWSSKRKSKPTDKGKSRQARRGRRHPGPLRSTFEVVAWPVVGCGVRHVGAVRVTYVHPRTHHLLSFELLPLTSELWTVEVDGGSGKEKATRKKQHARDERYTTKQAHGPPSRLNHKPIEGHYIIELWVECCVIPPRINDLSKRSKAPTNSFSFAQMGKLNENENKGFKNPFKPFIKVIKIPRSTSSPTRESTVIEAYLLPQQGLLAIPTAILCSLVKPEKN